MFFFYILWDQACTYSVFKGQIVLYQEYFVNNTYGSTSLRIHSCAPYQHLVHLPYPPLIASSKETCRALLGFILPQLFLL